MKVIRVRIFSSFERVRINPLTEHTIAYTNEIGVFLLFFFYSHVASLLSYNRTYRLRKPFEYANYVPHDTASKRLSTNKMYFLPFVFTFDKDKISALSVSVGTGKDPKRKSSLAPDTFDATGDNHIFFTLLCVPSLHPSRAFQILD